MMNPHSAKCGCMYRLLYVAISNVRTVYKATPAHSLYRSGFGSMGTTAFAIAVIVLLVLCGAVSLVYWKRQTVSCRVVLSRLCMRIYIHYISNLSTNGCIGVYVLYV